MTVISVLCPTRGRPDELRRSLAGLVDRAARPDDVQICVAIDQDDPESMDAAQDVIRWLDFVHVADERHGYEGLHHYVNALLPRATGDWLLLWNDDATMLTNHWDRVIGVEPVDAVLWPATDVCDDMVIFPCVPARWARTVGHFSLSPHNDSWWQDVGHALGRVRRIPVSVAHTPRSAYHDPAYYAGQQQLRDRDVETIRGIL